MRNGVRIKSTTRRGAAYLEGTAKGISGVGQPTSPTLSLVGQSEGNSSGVGQPTLSQAGLQAA